MNGLTWFVLAVLWWAAAAITARAAPDGWPSALLYASALGWTYLTAWRLAGAWAADARQTFKAVTLTAVILAAVGLLEIGAAARWVDYRRIRSALIGAEGPNDFVEDAALSFRRPPHVRWTGWPLTDMASLYNLPYRVDRPMTFSTDSRGFRNRTELSEAAIALLGDSYVEGWALSDDETVSVRLAERTGVPVANLGTAGYGSLQELRVLRRYAFPLHPRLVALFYFEGNDLDDDQAFENAMAFHADPHQPAGPPPPASRRWREFVDRSFTRTAFLELRRLTNALVPNGTNHYAWFRDRQGVDHRMYFYDFYATRALGDYERSRLRVTEAALAEAAAECRRRGIDLVVVFVPIKFRVYRDAVRFPPESPCAAWQPWDLESELERSCARAGVEFISLTDPMRRAAERGELLYLPADSHWNAAGAAFAAERVAEYWRSLPAGRR